jgi:hypothetical protein
MKKNKEFLYNYLNAYAPVAQESEGQQIWKFMKMHMVLHMAWFTSQMAELILVKL